MFLRVDDLTIRSRLSKEGARILTSTASSTAATTATSGASGAGTEGAETSVDFEIEPEVYRAVEMMVKALAAGTCVLRMNPGHDVYPMQRSHTEM